MSTLLSKPATHSEEKKLSYSNLLKSRNFATCTSGYHSESLRQSLTKVCSERCNNIPYEWQLDAAEAFFLGLDCTILAGTGSGKSLPFVMPSMVHDKIVVILSPLNALEDDQASKYLPNYTFCSLARQVARCRKMGLKAIAVNHKTFSASLCKVTIPSQQCCTSCSNSKFHLEGTPPAQIPNNLYFA